MILTLEDISKSYVNGSGTRVRKVLSNLNFSVAKGEMVAITGPSGSGKTTLLNIMGTLDAPDSGNIIFQGVSLAGKSNLEMAAFRNKSIGFVFQMHHLLPQLSAQENILLPTLAFSRKSNNISRAEMLMKALGIYDIRTQKPAELSGGECQRVAVARALINNPSLILADEPTGSLDNNNSRELVKLLKDVNTQFGTSMVMVTHNTTLAREMDKVYSLNDGVLTMAEI